MRADRADADQAHGLALQRARQGRVPPALSLRVQPSHDLALVHQQIPEDVLRHQGPEDAPDVGEHVVAPQRGIEHALHPGPGELHPSQVGQVWQRRDRARGIAEQDVAVRAAGEAVGHVGRRYGHQIGQVRRLDEPQILLGKLGEDQSLVHHVLRGWIPAVG